MRVGVIAGMILAVTTAAAIAGSANVGSVNLNLPTPPGFCEMSEKADPWEKGMLDFVGDNVRPFGNRLLSMSADCQQLAAFDAHRRRTVDEYFQYQTPISMEDKTADAVEKKACVELRSRGDQILSDLTKNSTEIIKKLPMDSQRFAGILDEDANACYPSVLQKFHTEDGTAKVRMIAYAIMTAKTKELLLYRGGLYSDADTASKFLAQLKEMVSAVNAANR